MNLNVDRYRYISAAFYESIPNTLFIRKEREKDSLCTRMAKLVLFAVYLFYKIKKCIRIPSHLVAKMIYGIIKALIICSNVNNAYG